MSSSRNKWHSSVNKLSAAPLNSEINVTPLVDVCLVPLIIFMVVAPMLQEGIDVALPYGPHAEQKPGERDDLTIAIMAEAGRTSCPRWSARS